MIDVAPISEEDAGDGSRITRAQLIAVIRQRLEHLMTEIQKALTELGFDGPVGRQIVLTGGGAELKGIADYAQQALGRVGADRPAARDDGAARRAFRARRSRRWRGSLFTRRRTRSTCARSSRRIRRW